MAVAKQVKVKLLEELYRTEWYNEDLEKELPGKWEKHGDLVLLPERTFSSPVWHENPNIFEVACKLLQVSRLARRIGPTQADDFRSPKVQLLFGDSTWVTKKENGILYSWNLTKCMFSSGNITEKQRIASWDLRGKTVVDMYAGIGYFTLTYLVHSKADIVYACEWNPDAVEALTQNLNLNKISSSRYEVLFGDNQKTCPVNVADHVNLGLIPSSENGWKTAAAALKIDSGGLLHVHGNVDTKLVPENQSEAYQTWLEYVKTSFEDIFQCLYPTDRWQISVQNVIKIKSFAPHVDHVVADVLCKPVITNQ